ncbi:putative leucine-rich repeat receptor-like serine/threonine-protein kinase [Apostasia shenzhenica]|uniref:Putative leucine-rich repeat receptor-like serine/threonine-protein kinase n=1 Tax=Apostasia shenzhenica TaxID=1088818 RepID=A0A2I0BFF3_9ASPA|nr:putative leucine-rich repeat receptor-like serine/threonine-protein kinase [Apostasia shenzhenica]
MIGVSWGLIVGVVVGVVIGILLAVAAFFCVRLRKKRGRIGFIGSSSSRRCSTVPIRANGVDSSTVLSDSTTGPGFHRINEDDGLSLWIGQNRKRVASVTGIPKYSYKDLQEATCNFTNLIGQGAFGPVYKAQMESGEIVAVKVLATDSKQGEKEFKAEVLLLGRLHHRNLVNLVGYCAEKGQHMLVYVYMPNGSLASHLYNDSRNALSWDLRVEIATDVARGLEYLHDGAIPPVIHRDVKSSNILLDRAMRARVADFGLSREEMISRNASVRGTYGYLDPDYVSSRSFTKKSDVYSFGVLLFELIAGRTPQQGLLEYVELASINAEEGMSWDEIVDSKLDGVYDAEEVNQVSTLAYKCINRSSSERPSMRDVVQALSSVIEARGQ